MRNFGFGLGFGTGMAGVENEWYDAAAYADLAAVADFNNDRYAVTMVALGDVPGATAAQLKVKRAATFAEFFAFTASSTSARTYTNSGGTIANDLAANAPRFTYANGKRQLRLENAATNLLLRSDDFNTIWASSGTATTTVTTNAVAAPDGTTTADKIIPNAAAGTHGRAQSVTAANATYTFSVYAKAGEYSRLFMDMSDLTTGDATIEFNLALGTITSVAGVSGSWTSPSSTITSVGNGWYRCTLTATKAAGTSINSIFYAHDGLISFTGDGTSGIYLWGAQLEASAFATDYIPTTTVARTRDIETARFSPLIEALTNRAVGSVIVRMKPNLGSNGTYRQLFSSDDGTGITNRVSLGINTNNVVRVDLSNAGVTSPSSLSTSEVNVDGAALGSAAAWDATGASVAHNGTALTGAGAAPGTRTVAILANRSSAAAYGNGFYDFVGIAPERLSNAILEGLAVPNPNQVMWLEGDSYMAGTLGVTLATDIRTATGIVGPTTALGGSTLATIADRIVAKTHWNPWILVMWDGSATGYGSTAAYLGEFARIAASKVSKFVFIPPGALPGQEGAYEDDMTMIRDSLFAAYPGNVLDWRPTLFALSDGGGTDTANVAAGVIPTSLVQGDGVHLLQPAMTAMAAAVDAFIDARGW